MKNNNKIDVSYFGNNDLDNTSSFVDLMSRTERKKREIERKRNSQKELKEILFEEEKNKIRNEKRDLKRKEKLNKIAKSSNETPKVELVNTNRKNKKNEDTFNKSEKLSNTTKFKNFSDEVKASIYDNVEENINTTNNKTKYGIGNLLVNGVFIIASLVFYIYSILFTNIQSDEINLLIGGVIILGMIAVFCISIICGKILYRVLSVLNYLIFIGFIIFNLLIVIKL